MATCCVTNPKKICSIQSCAISIIPGIDATAAGEWQLMLFFLGAGYRLYSDVLDIDDPLEFAIELPLNEDAEYIGQIIMPDGSGFVFGDNDEFDGIQFSTVLTFG